MTEMMYILQLTRKYILYSPVEYYHFKGTKRVSEMKLCIYFLHLKHLIYI